MPTRSCCATNTRPWSSATPSMYSSKGLKGWRRWLLLTVPPRSLPPLRKLVRIPINLDSLHLDFSLRSGLMSYPRRAQRGNKIMKILWLEALHHSTCPTMMRLTISTTWIVWWWISNRQGCLKWRMKIFSSNLMIGKLMSPTWRIQKRNKSHQRYNQKSVTLSAISMILIESKHLKFMRKSKKEITNCKRAKIQVVIRKPEQLVQWRNQALLSLQSTPTRLKYPHLMSHSEMGPITPKMSWKRRKIHSTRPKWPATLTDRNTTRPSGDMDTTTPTKLVVDIAAVHESITSTTKKHKDTIVRQVSSASIDLQTTRDSTKTK